MSVKIQVKRSTASSWTSVNPILDAGEIGFETDTGYFKIGNGSTAWNSLSYTISQSLNSSASPTFAGLTTTGNLVVGGNFTVNGNSTILNTETLTVEDNTIVLNSGATGAPSLNAGIEVERGSSTNVLLRWNESTDKWQVSENGTDYYDIINTNSLEARFADEHWHRSVRLATAAVLPNSPTYTAGTLDADGGYGIGATLESSSNARLTVDGLEAVTGNRILVKNQANALHNGIYDVTAQGSGSGHWILTRATDMDGSYPDQIDKGETVGCQEGSDNHYQQFYVSSTGTGTAGAHIIGTDNITFEQYSGTASFNLYGGLSVSGNTLSVISESASRIFVGASSIDLAPITQSDSSASAGMTFVSAINRDGYGRVLGVTTADALIALGTNTSGDYVASLVAGTGIGLANNSGENAQPTISIGQDVSTSASVTFAKVTAPLQGSVTGYVTGGLTGNVIGDVTGNSSTATTLQTARNISLNGDISGSASFNGSADITISSTIQPNSVALGTDTTGNYMSDLTQGTGVTITHTPGEGSNATIAIGQDIATNSSPTFAALNLNGNLVFEGATPNEFETTLTVVDPTADRTITLPNITGTVVTTGDTGTVTSTMIADGTIVNGDINSSAGIALSKLASGTSGQIIVANSSGVPTWVSETGDITISDTGVTAISSGVIVNADVNASAAIALSKLASGTSGQIVVANGSGVPTYTTISGDITVDGSGVAAIAANSVALGTDTTGNYVATITGGTGVTSTAATTGEGTTHTLSIGQSVATSASVTFGQLTTSGNVIVGGNLQVSGSVVTVNQSSLEIDDPFIYLNTTASASGIDTGVVASYYDGSHKHSGYFRDATDGKFKFFDSYTTEPSNPINTADPSYSPAPVVAEYFESTIATGTAPFTVSSTTAVTNLNADLLDGQHGSYYAPLASPTFTGTVTLPSGTVTSGMILDGTIVNADVNASAAIALSKLASGTSAQVVLANGSGVPTYTTVSGDVTIGSTGVTAIGSGVIVNADISASAAIELSKLATSTAGNIIVYNASGVPTSVAETGDVTISDTGVTAIASGVIVNADISATAAIDLGKIADVSTNAQVASYTLVLADKNKIVEIANASANTLTVPLNSSVAFPVGSQITFIQTGAGQTTITPAGGVTINGTPGLKLRAQWSSATLIKRATDTWVALGDLSA